MKNPEGSPIAVGVFILPNCQEGKCSKCFAYLRLQELELPTEQTSFVRG